MPDVETFQTKSVVGTLAMGRAFARRLAVGDCVALGGQLGAGKTVLVRGIADGLGLADKRLVSSPTFVLVQEYPTTPPMFHIDLYRLCDAENEITGLGLDEMLAAGVVLIEWADKAGDSLPRPRWQVDIRLAGPRSRRIDIRRVG